MPSPRDLRLPTPAIFAFDPANGRLLSFSAGGAALLAGLGLGKEDRPTLAQLEQRVSAEGQMVATVMRPSPVDKLARELRRVCLRSDGSTISMVRLWSKDANTILTVEVSSPAPEGIGEVDVLRLRLAELLDTAGDAILSADAQQNVILFNRQAETLFGYASAEIVGRPLAMLLPTEARDRHRAHVATFTHENQHSRLMSRRPEIRGQRKDGTTFAAEASIAKFEFGGAFVYTAVVRDLTERHKVLDALRRSEQGLARAQKIARLGSWDWNFVADTITGSAETYRILDLPQGVPMNYAAYLKRVHPDDLGMVTQVFLSAFEVGKSCGFGHRIVLSDDSVRYLHLEIQIERDEAGVALGTTGTVQDVTSLRHIEMELTLAKEEAEAANRAKSEFLANISHELRTPLNAILGFSEIMSTNVLGTLDASRYRDYAADIHRSGEHLLEVVNDILDLARVEAGQTVLHESDFSLEELAAGCARLVAEQAAAASLRVEIDCPPELPHLEGDERLCRQILINLLSNAIKFTPAGGVVRIRLSAVDGELCVAVADSGIGIAADDIPKLMKPFVQIESHLSRRFQGTGLGLSLCNEFMHLHGGSLSIESTLGRGTVVTARFPAVRLVRREEKFTDGESLILQANLQGIRA